MKLWTVLGALSGNSSAVMVRPSSMVMSAIGLAILTLSLYFRDARVKIEVGLCKGKKTYDKRAAAAQMDAKREIDRAIRARNR